MSYTLFVDESYQRDHFYLAGVLVDDAQYTVLSSALEGLGEQVRQRNGWLERPEFHGHALMNATEQWSSLHPYFGARVTIYTQALHALANSGARVFIEAVDVRRLNARFEYPPTPFEVVTSRLLRTVDQYCARHNGVCRVMADEREEYGAYEEIDNRFMWRTHSQLAMIQSPIIFVNSRTNYGIQAADMAVYIARRYLEQHGDTVTVKPVKKRLYKALTQSIESVNQWRP